MRQINPPSAEETLVSRGEYRYLRSGEPTGQVEFWSISRLPGGAEIVRSDVDARAIPGAASLICEFQRTPAGRASRLAMRFEKIELTVAAEFVFEESQVKIIRQEDGDNGFRREGVLEIADNYVVDYHPVISHDYVWRGYPAQAEGAAWSIPVFSPDLWAKGDEALAGRALRFTITPMPPKPCSVPAGEFPLALCYEVTLSDGVLAMAWYDTSGLPLRWYYPQKGYDFVLATLTRA